MNLDSDEEDDEPVKVQPSDPTVHDKSHFTSGSTSTKLPRRRITKKTGRKSTSNDEWELDCEVCGSKGINKVRDVLLSNDNSLRFISSRTTGLL